MKKFFLLFVFLLFFLCACTAPNETATQTQPTSIPASDPTSTPQRPAPIPSETPKPTEKTIEFQHDMPDSMDQFTDVRTEDAIFTKIYPALKQTEAPFGPDVKPVDAQIIYEIVGGKKVPRDLVLVCNEGAVNCLPVAWVRYTENGEPYFAVVLKIKNGDGSTGYFAWSIFGGLKPSVEQDKLFARIRKNPNGNRHINIPLSMNSPGAHGGHPIYVAFVNNADDMAAMFAFGETDIFPDDFKDVIPGTSFQ